jgi:hypothetical protein
MLRSRLRNIPDEPLETRPCVVKQFRLFQGTRFRLASQCSNLYCSDMPISDQTNLSRRQSNSYVTKSMQSFDLTPAPHSVRLVRMVPLALYAQVLFRHFWHDGRRGAGTVALQQPFTGFLTALLGLPMRCVLGVARENQLGLLTHVSILRRTTMMPPPVPKLWMATRRRCEDHRNLKIITRL